MIKKQDEEFRDIPGYPDYQVSNYGRVLSNRGSSPKYIGSITKNGRPMVTLTKAVNQHATFTIHQLVADAFLDQPEGLIIRHKDGDPSNNHVSNLEFGTLSDNTQDRIQHGTNGNKLTLRKVRIIRGLRKLGFTNKRLQEIFGVSKKCITRVCQRKTWRTA